MARSTVVSQEAIGLAKIEEQLRSLKLDSRSNRKEIEMLKADFKKLQEGVRNDVEGAKKEVMESKNYMENAIGELKSLILGLKGDCGKEGSVGYQEGNGRGILPLPKENKTAQSKDQGSHGSEVESENDRSSLVGISNDKMINIQLNSGFDKESCLSRYQSTLYCKPSPYKPSQYLLSKLGNYESLHKRCGPYTDSYNRTLKVLDSGNISNPTECNYIVWTPLEGMGNRILNMASAFLYALLTNRVFLVEHEADMADLFCEPFPNTSWLLPLDFPFKNDSEDSITLS
ncbi:hypothetical protein GH714_036664 [Hevea brasiliensis]|uniref:Fucosyltransferase n=1 Tax=Hevea brasiliensis TaxID=3981 RepID=A0A6A6NEZ7_HEVBR|nr:hypothetical protein GH714_036664 [Hevea brasiliensis]